MPDRPCSVLGCCDGRTSQRKEGRLHKLRRTEDVCLLEDWRQHRPGADKSNLFYRQLRGRLPLVIVRVQVTEGLPPLTLNLFVSVF